MAPIRYGFESSLLKAIFTDVRLDHLVEGLICEIDLFLGRAQSGTRSNDNSQEISSVTST